MIENLTVNSCVPASNCIAENNAAITNNCCKTDNCNGKSNGSELGMSIESNKNASNILITSFKSFKRYLL
jgi:hypothetical protein